MARGNNFKMDTMIVLSKVFTIFCDRCGVYYKLPDTDNTEGFESPQEASHTVKNDGWVEIDGGFYCPKCAMIIINKKKKK